VSPVGLWVRENRQLARPEQVVTIRGTILVSMAGSLHVAKAVAAEPASGQSEGEE
jgi:hypothetical protein